MNKQEIMELLNIGENREVEFKESYKKLLKSLWETYSSFANTRGGIIILGIKENKETKMCTIEGVEEVNNILKDFWNTINNSEKVSCNILNDDCVEIMKVENRMLLIVNVPNANRKDKPIYINNNPITGTYKRYHDGDYRCNKKEIQVLFSESTEESKDEIILNEFNINSIDKETLESYRKRFKLHKGDSHEWSNLTNEEFLYMIGAIDRKTSKLTLAGLLMFGYNRDIVKIKPSFFLDYREIDDFITTERWSNRITSSPDENREGNLWGFFSKVVNRLTADIPTPFALDKDLMRIDDTDVHKCVRERIGKLSYTCRLFRKWQYSDRKRTRLF